MRSVVVVDGDQKRVDLGRRCNGLYQHRFKHRPICMHTCTG
jgi:hypothetical protein